MNANPWASLKGGALNQMDGSLDLAGMHTTFVWAQQSLERAWQMGLKGRFLRKEMKPNSSILSSLGWWWVRIERVREYPLPIYHLSFIPCFLFFKRTIPSFLWKDCVKGSAVACLALRWTTTVIPTAEQRTSSSLMSTRLFRPTCHGHFALHTSLCLWPLPYFTTYSYWSGR